MKGIILAMLLAMPAAYADTITLGPDSCGTLRQCVSIPNDAAVDVTLYASLSFPKFTLYIDGVQYTAQSGNAANIVGASATALDGSTVILSANFTTYRTCTHSGRGQSCLTHWQLTDGTITR